MGLEKNEKYWKHNMPNSKDNTIDPHYEKPFPSTWFKQSGYYRQKTIKMPAQQVEDTLGCFGVATESMQRRKLKMINLDHKRGPTIYDSLDVFAQYYCAMNEFVFNEFTKNDINDDDYHDLPIQFDLCIIP